MEFVLILPLLEQEVLEAVMRELELVEPPRPDDAADALAAALTGWFQR